MRRIAIGTTALALVGLLVHCAADAPTAPRPGGGGNNNGAVQIALAVSDPNPGAGACPLVQATVTFNGGNVPDGTSVAFSTDLGVFEQNGKKTISVVTIGGAATTAVCSGSSGVANVHASATVQGKSGTASVTISFQSSPSAGSVSSCSPTFGSPTGGTALILSGVGFTGSLGTTRVLFTTAGVSREGLVTAVSSTQINVVTPAFPEVSAVSTPVQITIFFGLGTPSPTTLVAPSCFVFSTAPAAAPTVTAVLPSSGKNEGGTRVAVVGTGFVAPLQVFFGPAEALVQSVSYNQIVVLTPAATGIGLPNQNSAVDVTVREASNGSAGTLPAGYTYGPALKLIALQGFNVQPANGPFTPLTIIGQGFDAPVQVSLASLVATVLSVSATELVVVPATPIGCAGGSGSVKVTNLNTGETTSGLSFTYVASGMTITSVTPNIADVPGGGLDVVITGTNLFNPVVTLGGAPVTVVTFAVDGSSVTVHVPATTGTAQACGLNPPATELPVGPALAITVTNSGPGCSVTSAGAFQYTLPCL